MKFGPAIRALLPSTFERSAARVYRSVFVDLKKVAECIAPFLPKDARLLDIGGGDGELLNALLALRPDVSVTMVDVAESVGKFVESQHMKRVQLLPGTSIESHVETLTMPYDAALVSDVVHHLPATYRPQFLGSVYRALAPGGSIFVKDIEPGYFIAGLSLFCDKYVSGDRGVMLISQEELCQLANARLPQHTATEIGLYDRDRPNYIMKLDFAARDASA